MKSSNPVLGRLFDDNRRSGAVSSAVSSARYGGQAYGSTTYASPPPVATGPGYGNPGYGGPGYGGPVQDVRDTDRMTIDDVVVRTGALVALVIITATLSWNLLKTGSALTSLAMVGASIAGIVLVFVISFRRIVSPGLIALYSVLQGVLLGVVSRMFENAYPGVVVQAVAATMAVFLGMAFLYKSRVIRATPRFARWVIGALIGVVGLSLINWTLALFGHNLGIEYYAPTEHAGTIAIIFSLLCIGVGALTFILDFDQVEHGIATGMPKNFAWYCAFGMVVGLIYLYWQILRLLGYLRN